MKPSLPRIETAVPRLPHVQLEIAKAIGALMGADEDELARARRAEIAALRRDIEALARDIPKVFADAAVLAKSELRAALALVKASADDPKHPGWPAGTPGSRGGKFRPKDAAEADNSAGGSSVDDAAGDGQPKRYAARNTDTLTDETSSGANASAAAGSGNNSRDAQAFQYRSGERAPGLPDPPSFDTSDSAILEPGGDPPAPKATTQFRRQLSYDLDDGAQYAAGVTIINEDNTLAGALDRVANGMFGGNPVDVEFQAKIETANGTPESTFRIKAFLPVYGWRSVPWVAFGLLQGPGRVTITATNHTSFYTGVIVGANRVDRAGK